MPFENGLSLTPANAGGPVYYQYLLTGGTGQTSGGNTSSTLVPDARVLYDGQDASALPPGPFQLTQNVQTPHFPLRRLRGEPGPPVVPDVAGDGLQRRDRDHEEPVGLPGGSIPLGRDHGLSRLQRQGRPPAELIGEGSTAMWFLQCPGGRHALFEVARRPYTISDNYHQGVMGGTGANRFMLGTGDVTWFSNGATATQRCRRTTRSTPPSPGTPVAGHSSAPCRKDRKSGSVCLAAQATISILRTATAAAPAPTATSPNANYGGGSYVNCADPNQPGVKEVDSYLAALSPDRQTATASGHYYLVNNYNPGYFGDGKRVHGYGHEKLRVHDPALERANVADRFRMENRSGGPTSGINGICTWPPGTS